MTESKRWNIFWHCKTWVVISNNLVLVIISRLSGYLLSPFRHFLWLFKVLLSSGLESWHDRGKDWSLNKKGKAGSEWRWVGGRFWLKDECTETTPVFQTGLFLRCLEVQHSWISMGGRREQDIQRQRRSPSSSWCRWRPRKMKSPFTFGVQFYLVSQLLHAVYGKSTPTRCFTQPY